MMGRGRSWLPILLLAGLYVGVRCLHLDQVVTTDEPFWLGRFANFYRALRSGELIHTYQMAHPGVLTMWSGALAYALVVPDYARQVTENVRHVHGIGSVLRDIGEDPLQLLITTRVMGTLLQGVFFSISMVFMQRLFGTSITMLTGALIVFDPFLSGLGSALHVDGLFAIASFAALLGIAFAAQSSPTVMSPWLVAGALAACAWMTRATGVLLGVIAGGVLLWQCIGRIRSGNF